MKNQNQAIFENGIWKIEQEFLPDRNHSQKFNNSSKIIQGGSNKPVLMCACGSNLKCKGICREANLHRPRMANPIVKTKAAKDYVGVRKSWADKCPSAYEKP